MTTAELRNLLVRWWSSVQKTWGLTPFRSSVICVCLLLSSPITKSELCVMLKCHAPTVIRIRRKISQVPSASSTSFIFQSSGVKENSTYWCLRMKSAFTKKLKWSEIMPHNINRKKNWGFLVNLLNDTRPTFFHVLDMSFHFTAFEFRVDIVIRTVIWLRQVRSV